MLPLLSPGCDAGGAADQDEGPGGPPEIREFTKGGFVKGGLAIYVLSLYYYYHYFIIIYIIYYIIYI